MKYKHQNTSRNIAYGILAATIAFSGCSNKDTEKNDSDAVLKVNVTKPVDYDYDKIKKSGVLRMITRYSSNTYFLHQGREWGFEYELVNQFARLHNLRLKVVIIGPDENPYDLLNSGKGDLIAGNYTATQERKKYVQFTRPYNVVNQVVVFSDAIKDPPKSIKEMAWREIPVTIRQNSSYYQRLLKLRKEKIKVPIHLVPNEKDTESLLFDVSQNKYLATVADNNIFQASNKYMQGLKQGPVIARGDSIAWAIRKNAPELEKKLNKYLSKHFRPGKNGAPPKRSAFLNILRKRYFQEGPKLADYYSPRSRDKKSSVLIPYHNLIKQIADSADVNWLMIASLIAQETKFNTKSESWAGAVGLMQVLPRYSEVDNPKQLFDAKTNIREGIRIIKEHLKHYAYLDSTNRWAFSLAAYNAGPGHIADARRLVIDHNKNPNDWNNVANGLIMLMQQKYYKNARYGFCRGIETARYVRGIINRYETYETVLALRRWDNNNKTGPGVLGLFN